MLMDAESFLTAYRALPPEARHAVAVAIIREVDSTESTDEYDLRKQIEAGINSPSVPADAVFAGLRETARRLAERYG